MDRTDFLFRYTSDAVLVLDSERRVTQANPRAETLLQQDTAQMLGKSVADIIPDLRGSRAEGQLNDAATGTLERRIEHFSASKYTWYEVRAIPRKGEMILLMRDVSDRARQTRTEAVREAVRQIIMDAPIAINITRGPEHRYEIVNNMSRRLIGDREIEGRTARAAFPEINPALFDVLDEVYRTGKPVTMQDLEVSFDRGGTGKLVPGTFDVTYQPVFEADGTVSGILTTSVETTAYAAERKRIASQKPQKKD